MPKCKGSITALRLKYYKKHAYLPYLTFTIIIHIDWIFTF